MIVSFFNITKTAAVKCLTLINIEFWTRSSTFKGPIYKKRYLPVGRRTKFYNLNVFLPNITYVHHYRSPIVVAVIRWMGIGADFKSHTVLLKYREGYCISMLKYFIDFTLFIMHLSRPMTRLLTFVLLTHMYYTNRSFMFESEILISSCRLPR